MPRPRSTVNPLDAIEADASSRSFLPSSRPDPRQRSSPRAPTNRLRLIRRSTTSSTLLPPPLHPPSSRPAVCTPANLCTWADRRPESLATRLFLPGHRWRRGTVGKHRALGNEEDSGDDESWFPNASWTRAFAGGPWLAALLRPPYPRSHSTPAVPPPLPLPGSSVPGPNFHEPRHFFTRRDTPTTLASAACHCHHPSSVRSGAGGAPARDQERA